MSPNKCFKNKKNISCVMFKKFTLISFKKTCVYTTVSPYWIALQLLFSFKNIKNAFMKMKETENCWWGIFNLVLKTWILQHQDLRQVKMHLFVFISLFVFCGICSLHKSIYFYDVVRKNFKQKISTRVNQKKIKSTSEDENTSSGNTLNSDHWKTFLENCKPIRVWLWLVHKIVGNNCCSGLFAKFIQIQKRFLTSINKISILTWRLLYISDQHLLDKRDER